MFSHRKKIIVCGWSLFSADKSYELQSDAEIQRRLEQYEEALPATGWERLKFGLLKRDENGDPNPRLTHIFTSTFVGGFAGLIYGGYQKSQLAYLQFLRTNQATKFLTQTDAKKYLQDRVSIGFIKGAAQLGWRTSLFTFMFMSITNSVALYRNKDGILEYSLGGLGAGMSYRVHRGMRPVIVGGILGLAFGTVGGIVHNLVLRLTGLSMTDIRNAQYMFVAQRERSAQRGRDLARREEFYEEPDDQITLQKILADEESGRIEDNLETIGIQSQVNPAKN